MIPHRCTTYCEPDEGIHCIPNRFCRGATTVEKWQESANLFGLDLEIIKVVEEPDVTMEMMDRVLIYAKTQGYKLGRLHDDRDYIGYLVWMRDKS